MFHLNYSRKITFFVIFFQSSVDPLVGIFEQNKRILLSISPKSLLDRMAAAPFQIEIVYIQES